MSEKKYIYNIAQYLSEVSNDYPDRIAVAHIVSRDVSGNPIFEELTYTQINRLSDIYAFAFKENGICKQDKVLLLFKPCPKFFALVFAVFKIGAIAVLIDPGMGKENLFSCIRHVCPDALIANDKVHWIRLLYPSVFKSVRVAFSAGRISPPWVVNLDKLSREAFKKEYIIEPGSPDDTAAILFTTGSTGPAKGVIYTHEIFITQTETIREVYNAGPSEIDMPCFPLFGLFSLALGMKCVIPEMDFSRPAAVNPENLLEVIFRSNISFSFGSPTLWKKTAEYCIKKNIKLPVEKVLMAGAPVSEEIHRKVKKVISDNGETVVPYGATEALPIANFAGTEMLNETAELTRKGKGYCVGYPLKNVSIKVIKPIDGKIELWEKEVKELNTYEIGEIIVSGKLVTKEYYKLPEHTALAKIKDVNNHIWHRMGDMGYFDEKGRLWFCGRKSHVVRSGDKIFYPVCCEAIFNTHPQVNRSALVGVKDKNTGYIMPVMIIEPTKDVILSGICPVGCGNCPKKAVCSNVIFIHNKAQFIEELKEIRDRFNVTKGIKDFLFHPSFPVDIRHNAKIFREKLAVWAEKQLKDNNL